MSHSSSTRDAQKEELVIFLDGLDKRKYLEQLVQAGIVSVDQLAENEDIRIPGAPRMVTRLLQTKAQETEELRWVLRGKMIEYLQPLVQARIYTVPDLLAAETLPIPRMAARVVRKKAEEVHQARAVRDFLKSINQERHFETIASQLQITTPEQLRDTCVEKLTRSTSSRMVARFTVRKARELCPLDDPPSPPALTPQQKSEIRTIYQAVQQANHESFGTTFYETLLSMDTKATALFAGVSLKTLGRDFDDSLTAFVDNLDRETEFDAHRNALVERLLHYRVPCRTLWLAGDAFCLAAMAQCPEVELLSTLSSWKALYYAMIPPLHPALIRAASVTTETEWDLKRRDFFPRMHDALARRGYLYFTQWLQQQGNAAFVDHLWEVITSFRAYQQGTGGWQAFVEASRQLLQGMDSDEMKVTLLIELPLTVEDRMSSPEYGLKLGNVLTAAACALFGMDRVSGTFRAIQRERVWDQWSDIYRFAHYEFGERFYELFTRNLVIAHRLGRWPPCSASGLCTSSTWCSSASTKTWTRWFDPCWWTWEPGTESTT